MSDHVYLHGMIFEGRHGVTDDERAEPQPIEIDVDLYVDLREAGGSDDLSRTVDYSEVFDHCRPIVEERSFHLLEGIAEAIAGELLASFPRVDSVKVRAKKPGVPLRGVVEHAGIEIERERGG